MKKFLHLIIALLPLMGIAQSSREIDSLKSLLQSNRSDTTTANTINALCIKLVDAGDLVGAKAYAEKELTLSQTIGFRRGEGNAFVQLGNTANWMGNYAEASKNYYKALKIRETLKDFKGTANVFLNIGNVSLYQKNYNEALINYHRSLEMQNKINNKAGVANVYNCMAIISNEQNKYNEALRSYYMALKLYGELGRDGDAGYVYMGIAEIFIKQNKYSEAMQKYTQALGIMKEVEDIKGVAECYSDIGGLLFRQGRFPEAKRALKSALLLSNQTKNKSALKIIYDMSAKTDSAMGNFKSAYVNHQMFSSIKDDLFNEESTRKTVQTQMQYEFGKKEDATKAAQEKRNLVTAQEKQKQRIIIYSIAGGLLLVIIFAIFIFRSLHITRRQKYLIELQKNEVSRQKETVEQQKKVIEEKSKETTDNINYAKRIQDATMMSIPRVTELLPNSFIFNRGRDIVSGDFYFIEKISDNKIIFAVADSTSHGVSGSMMSILNSNLLGEAVRSGIHAPSKILDYVNTAIARAFHQTGENKEVKDGMDISLCALNTKTMKLEFAGAYNPLMIVRNKELIELDADKLPLGQAKQNYTNHEFTVQSGDVVYLSSDGFADQFGGDKNKKYKYKNFTSLLCRISDLSPAQQHYSISNEFSCWKRDFEQTDDILVMGVGI